MEEHPESQASDSEASSPLIVGPDGQPILQGQGSGEQVVQVTDLVEQPAKVMRIGTMIKQLLEEVRNAPLDDAARSRLQGPPDAGLQPPTVMSGLDNRGLRKRTSAGSGQGSAICLVKWR